MIVYFGKISNIDGNYVTLEIDFDVTKYGNLMNVHVIFDDGVKKIVGEILKVTVTQIVIGVIGEIENGGFVPGINAKPSFASRVRVINQDELTMILGPQVIEDSDHMYLGRSAIYNGYEIHVGVNQLLINHFAILGNTGSGKSSTFARIIQNIFTTSKYLPVNANIFVFDAYAEYKT